MIGALHMSGDDDDDDDVGRCVQLGGRVMESVLGDMW